MKDFDIEKKKCLDKLYLPDRSRKGDVDTPIISLIDYINGCTNYYTTSSCSGRIMLLTEAACKPEVQWLYVTHEYATSEEVLAALTCKLPQDRVWLRQENLILHVACRTLDDANRLLKIARDLGLRRSGVIADSNIIIVEICSTEKMDVPLAQEGKLLVEESYIRLVVDIANQKFSRGREKLVALEQDIRAQLV